MPMPDGQIIVTILAIFFIAGLVKGVLGFGLPIVTMAFLPLFVPIEKAIVLSAFVQPATNLFQLASAGMVGRAVQTAWPVLVALLPGVAIGAWFLSSIDSETLLLIVGITIIAFSIINLIGYGIQIPDGKRIIVGYGFGAVAGVVGVLTSLNGWAFVMYMVGVGAERNLFRSTIALLFLVSGFLISSSFWVLGLLDWTLFTIGVATLCTAFPGMWLGNRIGSNLPADAFRRTLLIALVVVGGMLVYRALG